MRERGIARERDEAVLGESSIAAPIFDHSGTPSARSAWSAKPTGSSRAARPGIAGAVTEAARGVSRELGARRWPAPPI